MMENSENKEDEEVKEEGEEEREEEREDKAKVDEVSAPKQKTNLKLLVVAIIIIILFVSTVIFSGQNNPNPTKNMVFYRDQDVMDSYSGNVRDVNVDLSEVKLVLRDAGTDSSNSTEVLTDGIVVETQGDLRCIFHDKNKNGRLDPDDEFMVQNAYVGDGIQIIKKSNDSKLAFHTF
ncbi:MAG: hypothetical protein JSW00_01970 [Thermoplasmata archaeon]|nr:MAG: hypothetical protein JSW00_01970 [Thermoplasmata archaeon]